VDGFEYSGTVLRQILPSESLLKWSAPEWDAGTLMAVGEPETRPNATTISKRLGHNLTPCIGTTWQQALPAKYHPLFLHRLLQPLQPRRLRLLHAPEARQETH
jgi:hypothetical protein